MKKTLIFAVLMTAGLLSCNKTEVTPNENSSDEIAVSAFAGTSTIGTKSAVDGTAFPAGYDMLISAYKEQVTGEDADNYFTGAKFKKDESGTWKGTSKHYWPLSGAKLDFLCVASAGLNTAGNGIVPTATWNADNCASQVVLVMPDNSENSAETPVHGSFDDVMYGAANGQSYAFGGTPVIFKHAMAAVVFKFKSSVGDDEAKNYGITIEDVQVSKAFHSGKLTITNGTADGPVGGDLKAEWSEWADQKTYNPSAETPTYGVKAREWDNTNDGIKPNEKTFPTTGCWTETAGSWPVKTTFSDKKFGDCYVILPGQQAKSDLVIKFTVHNGKEGTGEDATKLNTQMTYTYQCNDIWQMGKKYIYEISFNLNEIEIKPSVEDWVPVLNPIDVH